MFLLIDNSNTRTKFCLGNAKSLLPETLRRLPTESLSPSSIEALIEEFSFDATVICSVVPKKAEILRACLPGPVHEVSCLSPLNHGISYPHPEQIGADRLANSMAAMHHYGYPALVVDFGTAVTFDVLDELGCYSGGVIAPGLAAMNDYLAHRTALLPKIEPREPLSAIGKSTEEAMQVGAVYGYRGLVREILTRLEEELGSPAQIIATGGDAALIAKGLPMIQHLDPFLTLEGLRLIALELLKSKKF